MYKLLKDIDGNIFGASKTDGNYLISFHFDFANTDYAEFKKAVTAGAELQDADGNVMTEQAAQAFVATLTAAIQELKAELDTTKARLAALEAK